MPTEIKKINKTIDEFVKAMKRKMAEKHSKGWEGWDIVRAKLPESEIGDLIIEVRSGTAGVGSFTFKFDHMAELTGKTADQIIAARRAAE